MKLLGRLDVRLGLVTLLLFVALGAVLINVVGAASERYALEVTQRINLDVALHAAEDMPLLENGVVNQVALKELAHHVMFINPIVEVYLVDPQGQILAHALPYDTVLLERIDMAPVQQLLDAPGQLPVFGDDPRSPGQAKVFSVSPIENAGETAAFLYTVLNGRDLAGVQASLQDSYNLRVASAAVAASVVVAIVAGLLIFALLVRPLRRLISHVRQYREEGYQGSIPASIVSTRAGELGELQQAIVAMSERIEQQFELLQDSDRTRRELVANVSHDLRTPLASMQGYLETVLQKQELPAAERREYLEIACKHSQRLNSLIGELFELAKLESNGVAPEPEAFAVTELLQDLIHDHQLQADRRHIALELEAEDPALMVYADLGLIHRVLENLLGNALKHVPEGGRVTLRVRADADRVWLEVADTGSGIAETELPHIFDRFYQPQNTSAEGGSGLGLAIVKRIVELHDSEVQVASQRDRGTAFSFWLPGGALAAA